MFRAVCISLVFCFFHVRSQFIDFEEDPRPLCPCGNNDSSINTRVTGGHNAGEGRFPYASCLIDATWRAEELRNTIPFCGATLITDSHVITAAHCVKTDIPISSLWILVIMYFLDPEGGHLREGSITSCNFHCTRDH
uniref:U30-Nephitoxin-Nsp1a_1 n=1 Tax=Nephila sp. SGP-2016 TaxID=1905176 RepID=A0A4Q8K1C2_9ARAC